jgi:putative phosphoesterase
MTLGVISDTHGLIRHRALDALAGVCHIVHAGDVGSPEVLDALRAIAPMTAVRGNMDSSELELPWSAAVEVGGVPIYVLHDRYLLDLDPRAAGFAAVISGHTHLPDYEQHDGVLYLNPGSAGPRRTNKPVSVARLTVEGKQLGWRVIELV